MYGNNFWLTRVCKNIVIFLILRFVLFVFYCLGTIILLPISNLFASYQRIRTIYSSWYHYYHLSLVHNSAEWYFHTIKDRQIYRLLPHLCHKVWRRTIFWCNKLHILRSGVLYCCTHIVWFILMTQKISTVWWYYDNMTLASNLPLNMALKMALK